MWRRILTLFLAGKVLGLFFGRRGGRGAFYRRPHSYGLGSRHHAMNDLMGLMGLHRRRRSFI